jgi:L,D-peptidoglycan transpeptidase YkuD (ErfK/YbiS/YcfS/YnhG family)
MMALRVRRHFSRALVAAVLLSGLVSVSVSVIGVGAAIDRGAALGHPDSTCPTPLPGVGTSPRNVHELVTVEAPSMTSTVASVSLWSRIGTCFERVDGPWIASVGRSGLSSHKVEGDGTTPIGEYSIGPVMYGIAPNPGVAYQYHRIVCGDWWDEAPSSPMYNRFVHVACGTAPPFGGDSEALWRVVPQYNYFAVVEYNASPIVPGRGSAIFVHETTGVPTAGCVALETGALLTLLRWLRPVDHPLIVISVQTGSRG